MSLKSLAFPVLPSSTRSPVDARRMKTIERLQEQKQLVENPNYVKTVKKWATVNGQRQLVHELPTGRRLRQGGVHDLVVESHHDPLPWLRCRARHRRC